MLRYGARVQVFFVFVIFGIYVNATSGASILLLQLHLLLVNLVGLRDLEVLVLLCVDHNLIHLLDSIVEADLALGSVLLDFLQLLLHLAVHAAH